MSTGYYTGDRRQASHWKDDQLTGTILGSLDPTLGYGEVRVISDYDWRALDLIGWDIAPATPPPPPPPGNTAPVAVNDEGSTNEDTVLSGAAPGVLANDTDADNDPLTVTANSATSANANSR